jgi:hypothetical protein
MQTFIATALCVSSGAFVGLVVRARTTDIIDRLRARCGALEIAKDNAERDLDMERLSNPARINWEDPNVAARADLLVARIMNDDLRERIKREDMRARFDALVIDLRDPNGGAS